MNVYLGGCAPQINILGVGNSTTMEVIKVARPGKFWKTESALAYFLLLPALVFLILFMFYPIVYVFLCLFLRLISWRN